MAEFTTTFADLKRIAHHALGKDPDSSLVTTAEIVNVAIEELCAARPWSWLLKIVALDSTASTAALSSLPADFAGVHVVHQKTSASGILYHDEIRPFEPNQNERSHGTYRYVLETDAQGTQTGNPSYVLNILPEPPATVTGFAKLIYFRTIAKLANDTDVPDMPPVYHVILRQLVRARALLEDHQEPYGTNEYARYAQMLDAAALRDSARQSNTTTDEATATARS